MNKYGLLGRKLGHSYSKIIHEYIFKKNNIDATYDLIEIEEESLKDYVDYLKKGIYKGYNVTIPYKETVIKYCDILTDAAKEIGAVNCLSLKDGLVVGDNTDYYGLLEEFKYYNLDLKNKNCYILGTGGASKAADYALKLRGCNTCKVSRSSDKGITYQELACRNDIDVIVNTTPIGMWPNVNESVIDEATCQKAKIVVDLIFNPKTTKLMSYNKNSYNGLLMLVYQAIKAELNWQSNIIYDINELLSVLE